MRYGKLAPLIACVAFLIACYLLYRALSGYDRANIVEAVFAVTGARLALGALFVAASYFALTLFDALALRYIEAKLPYRRVALASFTALSIGHTLGVAAASSGAVRYRFYSRWGLGAGDIARIILFCATTVLLGLNTLAAFTLLFQASAASTLPGLSRSGVIILGLACFLLTALYVALAALLKEPLKLQRWEIPIPPVKLALAQVAVGTINFGLVAAALYTLLPGTVVGGYVAVATVYVLANAASIASHVPGGLGVLEAVVIHAVPELSVVGALVVFRFLYFLVPFTAGAALFAIYELAQRRRGSVR